MKLGVLFIFLIYYGLMSLFFIFGQPYLSEEYVNTIELIDTNIDYRTGYYNIEVFYEDFNWWGDGDTGWISRPILNGWYLEQNNENCVDDENDDCERSNDNECQLYYWNDIDLSNCQQGIKISGFVSEDSFNGTKPLYLKLCNGSCNDLDNFIRIHKISDGINLGYWEYDINKDDYAVENFNFGFNATNISSGESYFLDDITIECQVTQEYLEDPSTLDTSVSIKDFFVMLGFGIGLPDDTPIWFKIIFVLWQTIITILFLALLYQAIRGS